MIQRIQSLYLAVTLIFLFIVTLGTGIFNFQAPDNLYKLTSFGIKQFDVNGSMVETRYVPFYFGGFLLILSCFLSLIVFKNLKRQLSIARFTAFLYFIVLVCLGFSAFLGTYFTGEETVTVSMGTGFYLLLIGFLFVLMAIRGIQRDKKLIDSVNRLR